MASRARALLDVVSTGRTRCLRWGWAGLPSFPPSPSSVAVYGVAVAAPMFIPAGMSSGCPVVRTKVL
jgi:hypothetical protein